MEKSQKTPSQKRLETIKKNKTKRKAKKFIFGIGITSVVLIVATYAWFIGITTVEVSTFNVNIAASEGLSLSLDGETFTTTIEVDEAKITTDLQEKYSTNINHWVDSDPENADIDATLGLVPLSSNGKLNTTNSRIDFYSKKSITSSNIGYRLRTTKVDYSTNVTPAEDKYYIMFDLFVKNASGTSYNSEYDAGEDEDVFLSDSSTVEYLPASGEGTSGSGLENSIRIGMYGLGRVKATGTTLSTIQGISCASTLSDDGVTNLCGKDRGKTWNVWEPNDTKHTDTAISHFNLVCVKRDTDGTPLTGNARRCNQIADGTQVSTYAVVNEINSDLTPHVSIYDNLNGYTRSDTPRVLEQQVFYTDTDRNVNDQDKEAFMALAPNSITKVRVYIWLEAQDVDNYDISATYGQLSITFGLTKERFTDNESGEA
jgi:hypothetical protein